MNSADTRFVIALTFTLIWQIKVQRVARRCFQCNTRCTVIATTLLSVYNHRRLNNNYYHYDARIILHRKLAESGYYYNITTAYVWTPAAGVRDDPLAQRHRRYCYLHAVRVVLINILFLFIYFFILFFILLEKGRWQMSDYVRNK